MPRSIFGEMIKTEIPEYSVANLSVEKDQFYTDPVIAKECFEILLSYLKNNNYNQDEYTFLEPSAGSGSFYDLLPSNRLGLDLEPRHEGIQQQDFLQWQPDKSHKYIAVGNPPFGMNGTLALAFMKRLKDCNCDIIAFILPMKFNGEEYIPKLNSMGWYLHHTEDLQPDAFILPTGKRRTVNCVWQIWSRVKNLPEPKDNKVVQAKMKVFNHRDSKEKINSVPYDVIICYDYFEGGFQKSTDISIVDECKNDLTAIKFDKEVRDEGIRYVMEIDWHNYSMKKSNGANIIKLSSVKKALIDGGFYLNSDKVKCSCSFYVLNTREDYRENAFKKYEKYGADVFIPMDWFGDLKIYRNIDELKDIYTSFYAITVKDSVDEFVEYLNNVDMDNYTRVGTNNTHGISNDNFKKLLIDGGYYKQVNRLQLR